VQQTQQKFDNLTVDEIALHYTTLQ